MILRRLGNKKKIAKEIQKYFPAHSYYIEPFFGAGGMFFNKPKAKYNIVNDLNSDVFNLFNVVSNKKDELHEAFYKMPISEELFKHWMHNKETTDVMRAVRFIFLSNFSFLGKMDCMTFNNKNSKQNVLDGLLPTFDFLFGVEFGNKDAVSFLKSISIKDKEKAFVYCDPPYLGTTDNYSDSFTKDISNDLFECLCNSGFKFALSEFEHPFILEQAKQRNLNVIIIGERQNLKNRRTEILITNYQNNQKSLFE